MKHKYGSHSYRLQQPTDHITNRGSNYISNPQPTEHKGRCSGRGASWSCAIDGNLPDVEFLIDLGRPASHIRNLLLSLSWAGLAARC
jgi:hypothetical protein